MNGAGRDQTGEKPDPPAGPNPAAKENVKNSGLKVKTVGRHAASVDNATVRLGMALQLAHRVRRAQPDEIPFILVNETRQLLSYRQAAFWRLDGGKPVLASLSGLAVIDKNAPYALWINRFAKWRIGNAARARDGSGRDASLAELAGGKGGPAWLADWKEWVPEHCADAVLFGPGGWACGYLCLFRENAFTQGETTLFGHVAEAYGDSLGASMMRPRRLARFSFWRVAGLLLAVLAAAAMFMPQPQSALAQAEVAPNRPVIVRAGVEGVIEEVMVESNQMVRKGQPLLRLDDTQLRTRLTVAEKAEEMARVELRQLQQAALRDAKSKARLPLAQGRVEQLAAEKEYVESLLERVAASSPMDGVALVDNPDEWIGRPVSLGQKLMMVADPGDVMLEIFLPIGEAMPLAKGDELLFFPNVNPTAPIRAKIVFIGYRAVETPGVGMAFRLRAEFAAEGEAAPMLGLRGMARMTGKPLPLGLIILRRPIMAVRQWLGW